MFSSQASLLASGCLFSLVAESTNPASPSLWSPAELGFPGPPLVSAGMETWAKSLLLPELWGSRLQGSRRLGLFMLPSS